jgi:hypothetical protein
MAAERERREKEREEFKKAQELESLRRAFKRIDKKGDGHIDCDELTAEVRMCRALLLCALLLPCLRCGSSSCYMHLKHSARCVRS